MGEESEKDKEFMDLAIEEAENALAAGEVPVGAVLVMDGKVVAGASNSPIAMNDPSAHAEILAIRKAGQVMGNYRLNEATLYVTIEPCVMCAGAILQARLARLVYGADDPKSGAISSLYQVLGDKRLNHEVAVTAGVLKEACRELLSSFFRQKRLKSRDAEIASC